MVGVLGGRASRYSFPRGDDRVVGIQKVRIVVE